MKITTGAFGEMQNNLQIKKIFSFFVNILKYVYQQQVSKIYKTFYKPIPSVLLKM